MELEIAVVPSLAEVSADAWNALCDPEDPFTEYGFLRLLETSESVGTEQSGWLPRHLLARQVEGDQRTLVGALPLYLKNNSYGEFIFDFGWANAAHRAGLSYYPKLVSAVPFTPAGGRRILTREEDREGLTTALIAAAQAVAEHDGASSLHVLFCTGEESERLEALGMHARRSTQYHLENRDGLDSFDAFLASLRSPSRKQVRKERERARAHGLTLSMRSFAELPEADVAAMWSFYRSTVAAHGGQRYLTRGFFETLHENPHAFAAMAHDGDKPMAGALFFYKGHSLYGRYWGARAELPMLHFELCYYLPLEWGLARGLTRFEAGAQGEHKIKRGFLPNTCHSTHWAAHAGLDRAIADFVRQEASYVADEQALLTEGTPFRRG